MKEKGYLASAIYKKLQGWEKKKQLVFNNGNPVPKCPRWNTCPDPCTKGMSRRCEQDVNFNVRGSTHPYEFFFQFYIVSPSTASRRDGVILENDSTLLYFIKNHSPLGTILKTCPTVVM